MLELKDRQIAAIKRQYRNSLPAIKKIESLKKKINELGVELEREMAYLEGGEAGIRALTGGYNSYDLIKCEYVPQFNEDGTPKMDKEGKYQVKKQVLTFVPPVEAPVTETGNDFDADSERLFNELENEVAQMEVEKDYLNKVGKLEADPQSFAEQMSVTMPANDNTSTEAND